MNVPNKLTILRVVLAPLFLLLLLWNFPFHYLAACVVFVVASVTDFLDGRLARKYQLITNIGKFLDPLADKMLTTAAFLGFLAQGQLDAWAVMIILSREFLVTSVRLMAARDGTVVAANLWGKTKTVAQMIAVIYMLVALEFSTWPARFAFAAALPAELFTVLLTVGRVLVWISVILTVISGAVYFNGYKHLLFEKDVK